MNQQTTAEGAHYIGIDLSLTATGIAVWDGERLTVHTVKSKPDDGTIDGFLARCEQIAADIVAITKPGLSSRIAIEGLSMHSKSSSLDKTFGSWWLVLSALAADSVAVITPAQRAKYATGKGNAGKDEVMLAVARRYPDAEITNNNEADAVVLVAMLARHHEHPVELSMPAVNLVALEKVRWAA